ncbi:MAG: type 1 glutamine amidotransferase domain-containing protein [Bdellovibrionia bacterium]
MKTLAFLMTFLAALNGNAAPSKKVLVVLSSENKITLKDGITHPTGFFLSELMVPVRAIIKAGFEPVFATPKGNEPAMDKVSDSSGWFASEDEYREIRGHYERLEGIKRPLRLADAVAGATTAFAGILVPGGHAPMEDLLKDPDLGRLLRAFHAARRPTALICHGPIALLAALDNPDAYLAAVTELSSAQTLGDWKKVAELQGTLERLTKNWIYRDYAMTAFSTKEELQEEPNGSDNALGGFVKFYPDEALGFAGGKVTVNATKWKSLAVRDRELITGQNPMSDKEFAALLVKALAQ